jgi:mono/diheme cytochrome c family protein
MLLSPVTSSLHPRTFAHATVLYIALTMIGDERVLLADASLQTGSDVYQAACAACHGLDGRGAPRDIVGFDAPLPDFTDCAFTTSEADFDWTAVVHLGGRARKLSRMMPAFGDALSNEQIQRVIDYIRGFCRSRAWPHGNLNLPRPLITGKAFPENEAFVRVAQMAGQAVESRFVYERRLGPRSEVDVAVPFTVRHAFERWQRGIGDVEIGLKHVVAGSARAGSIVSAGVEVTFPTGNDALGLGRRLTVFEPFGVYSQALPADAFLHVQIGLEVPLNLPMPKEAFWRGAIGKTISQRQWGRAWSPMIEVLGARELEFGAPAVWDLLPQLQVTLSRRQHISVNGGVRLPVNLRFVRGSTAVAYVLWDWADGGLFDGW